MGAKVLQGGDIIGYAAGRISAILHPRAWIGLAKLGWQHGLQNGSRRLLSSICQPPKRSVRMKRSVRTKSLIREKTVKSQYKEMGKEIVQNQNRGRTRLKLGKGGLRPGARQEAGPTGSPACQ